MGNGDKFVFSGRMEKVKSGVYPRLKENRVREGTHNSPLDPAGRNPFLDVFRAHRGEPYILNLARAISRSWEVTEKVIYPFEPVVGVTRPEYPITEHFSWGIQIDRRALLDEAKDEGERAELEEIFGEMTPLDFKHMDERAFELIGKEKFDVLDKDDMMRPGGYQGHTVPGYPRLLEKGLRGMLLYIDECEEKNARTEENKNFYEACRIIIRAMQKWLTDHAEAAEKLAETEEDETQKRYYLEIAENCRFVSVEKPRTLYNAVQLAWTLCLFDWCDCIGRADKYLYPFYKYSVEHGDVLPVEDCLAAFILKTWENGIHNITLSGTDEDGRDSTNEITYTILQLIRAIHDSHPRVTVRIHKNTPRDLLDLSVKILSEGMSDPTFVSDETVIPGLLALDIPLRDARDYTVLGCQEIEIPGKSNTGCEDGLFNVGKVFEYAVRGGRSVSCPDVQMGPVTSPLRECKSFEEFYENYLIQLRYFTGLFLDLCNRGQEIRAANFAKLVKTPFTEGCLERATPHDAGGPLYNHGVVETAGIAAVSDSMTAIKKLVFEEKKMTADELLDALECNFEGKEDIRRMLLESSPKFGNDNDEADGMAVRVLDDFWSLIGEYRSVRGGRFTGACSLLEAGISFGRSMCAMPDGRHACEPLGNTMGPRPGADINGLTAMLSSVAKLPLEKGAGGTTLNVVLTTSLLSDEETRKKVADTLFTYFMHGGQMAQITTANLDELLDAQKHPERHGDLMVRIGGFSIQFVQLGKSSQNEIISRYAGIQS